VIYDRQGDIQNIMTSEHGESKNPQNCLAEAHVCKSTAADQINKTGQRVADAEAKIGPAGRGASPAK